MASIVPHLRHTLNQRVMCKVIIMENKKSYLCAIVVAYLAIRVQIILNTLPVTSVVISVLKALEGMCTVILEYHVYHIPAGFTVLMT